MDTTVNSANDDCTIAVVLKWSKKVIEFETKVCVPTPSDPTPLLTGRTFKETVFSLTKVPVERQKIVVTSKGSSKVVKWWKGILKDDFDFGSALADSMLTTSRIDLKATLMGTAEVLESNKDEQIFIEDMATSERKEMERKEIAESMASVAAMIPALQVPPMDRLPSETNGDDNTDVKHLPMIVSDFEEVRAYDRLVHGYSQPRIDALLRKQQQQQGNETSQESTKPQLLGRTVMTMGLQLQRAYVNDICVLEECGTLVSGMDDGHIQMWKHCRRARDVIHQPGIMGVAEVFSGVDSVLALDNTGTTDAAFCTAGRGCLRIWNSDGDPLLGGIPSPAPQHASPTDLIQVPICNSSNETPTLCLAARYRIYIPPTRRPRLVPQDEAGRQRVAEIEASEARRNENLEDLSKLAHLFIAHTGSSTGDHRPTLHSIMSRTSAPVTALVSWRDKDNTILALGDLRGGILFQKVSISEPSTHEARIRVVDLKRVQFVSAESASESRSSIVSMRYDTIRKQLWVSTNETAPTVLSPEVFGSGLMCCIPLSSPRAVHCIDAHTLVRNSLSGGDADGLLFSLDGHKDAVHCLLPLPNGDLVTTGGKHDATTQVWSSHQLEQAIASPPSSESPERTTSDSDTIENLPSSQSVPKKILTQAATPNLCKDAGYVFAVEVLPDFKHKENASQGEVPPFAIAAARYNVVKLIL